MTEDGGIIKFMMEEGKGDLIEEKDTVFYRHETRYNNGYLVDFAEKRKIIDKFEMGDLRYQEYYKIAFRTMRKGDACWVRFSKEYHKGIY